VLMVEASGTAPESCIAFELLQRYDSIYILTSNEQQVKKKGPKPFFPIQIFIKEIECSTLEDLSDLVLVHTKQLDSLLKS